MPTRQLVLPLACAVGLLALGSPARAADDAASLQFTVPAPDPVQAGEVLSFQALAVNVGPVAWAAGSYYWVADIYDLDFNFVGRTDQVSPPTAVAPGAVAAVSLPFNVPETMSGRFLYRISLIKDSKTLIQSEYKGFQVVAKVTPPPPQVSTYAVSGNLVQTMKAPNTQHGHQTSGTTNLNVVGKVRDTSYLFNTYILHQPGQVFNVYTIAADVYAPWGTVHAGDVIPHLGTLSVDGQGMRGGILEQAKSRYNWSVIGGQTITSQAGTVNANGRFARTLYAGKFGADLGHHVSASVNYLTSTDEPGSLSSNPNSNNFKGPTLVPQKNVGAGLSLVWQALPKLKFSADYQSNQFYANLAKTPVKDTAYRGQVDWERQSFKLVAYYQRAGPKFASFGAPSIVGNRLTNDVLLNWHPSAWYKLFLSADQFSDNLANDSTLLTTTQRTLTMAHSFDLRTGTALKLNGALNTAVGKPSTALNNQTTTVGAGITQAVHAQSFSLNGQQSQFRDKTGFSHGLNTLAFGVSANLALPRQWRATFGVNDTEASDIVDGSRRSNRSVSPSLTWPIGQAWTGQIWGVWTTSKSNSPTAPSDTVNTSANSEFTWKQSRSFSLTFGLAANKNKDKIAPGNNSSSVVLSGRYSYSF